MLHVQDLMSTNMFTLKKSDSLMAAKSLMELARIRHIPVIEEGNIFVGLITHRDILSSTLSKLADIGRDEQDEIEASIPVSEIMRDDVYTVAPDASLRDAAELLLNHKYGCLPVIEKDMLVGIITEADFLRLTIELMDALDT
ncbi:CBS domain-containing protein [Halodesulfovibrio marinisediminis]|uniref:CBS domain-containing membrane protein n=1 Tax=Halodesulfovibrio marinisediminis DSM 17456 TaxID=1121457 RepID=A0A1N6E4P1_9BACT|nr:CBS domain-containing protein [Halodesulfovibrio marinisediminis]SIN78000.1 CBS domain-containing membrane protein [Halodesulfovibrio marinisediminis DSM 17456]